MPPIGGVRGLELSRRYFHEHGLPLLRRRFPMLVDRVAAGLISGGLPSGCGSEVMGFDDELSRDHNWGPRFFLVLDEVDYAAHAPELREALRELPDEFLGSRTHFTSMPREHAHLVTPRGVIAGNLGRDTVPENDVEWLALPEHRLFELLSGEIFHEPKPLLTPALAPFRACPDNVRRKRLQAAWWMLAASGQGLRSVARGDLAITRVAASNAAIAGMRMAFTIAGRYAPCQKWLARAFAELRGRNDALAAAVIAMSTWSDVADYPARLLALTRALVDELNAARLCEPVERTVRDEWPFGPFSRLTHTAMAALEATLRPPLAGAMHRAPLDLWTLTGSCVTPAMSAAVARCEEP
jgi:hypothetical protein